MSSTILLGGRTLRSTFEPCIGGEVLTVSRNFDLEDVHVEGAERIAEAVAKYDVDRFIHVSSYNANINSPSEFFATKVSRNWNTVFGGTNFIPRDVVKL